MYMNAGRGQGVSQAGVAADGWRLAWDCAQTRVVRGGLVAGGKSKHRLHRTTERDGELVMKERGRGCCSCADAKWADLGPSYTEAQRRRAGVEFTSTTSSQAMSTGRGSVQHAAACTRGAVLEPWRVKVESGWLRDRWSNRYTACYTTRPHAKCLCHSPNMRLPERRRGWSWSDAGGVLGSRGHGSISRSRNPVAGQQAR